MNRKFFTVALAAVLTVSAVFAQSQGKDRVFQDLASQKVTKGDFEQVRTVNSARGKRNIRSSGTFILCTEGIVWNTVKPFASSMIITPTFISQTGADGSASVIDGSDNAMFESIAGAITSVFSGDTETLSQNFTIAYSAPAAGQWCVVLTPKSSSLSSVMQTLTLNGHFTADASVIDSMVISENADNSVTYNFSNQTYSKELTQDEKALFSAK